MANFAMSPNELGAKTAATIIERRRCLYDRPRSKHLKQLFEKSGGRNRL